MNNNNTNTLPMGDNRPIKEEIINNIYLESYEEKGIDTSAVLNGTLTLEQFEKGIKNQEMKKTFLFGSIIIIIILLIAILNKKNN